jgi:hypothetical protein
MIWFDRSRRSRSFGQSVDHGDDVPARGQSLQFVWSEITIRRSGPSPDRLCVNPWLGVQRFQRKMAGYIPPRVE